MATKINNKKFIRFNAKPKLSNGSLEALKWLALLSMLVDHFNALVLYQFNKYSFTWYQIGRLAAPLFVLILAYNLARPAQQLSNTASRLPRIRRVIGLTFVCGLLSVPIILWAFPYERWLPNIMFNFSCGALAIYLLTAAEEQINKNNKPAISYWYYYLAAILVVLLLGGWPEYSYPATITLILAYIFFRQQQKQPAKQFNFNLLVIGLMLMLALASWYRINLTHNAMLALPFFIAAYYIEINLPKRTPKIFFYAFYPLHFIVLAGVARVVA